MSTRAWYKYNCETGGELTPSNYTYVIALPAICATDRPDICAILGVFQEGSTHPASFSPRLNSYITASLSFASAQPASGKKFVYTRDC